MQCVHVNAHVCNDQITKGCFDVARDGFIISSLVSVRSEAGDVVFFPTRVRERDRARPGKAGIIGRRRESGVYGVVSNLAIFDSVVQNIRRSRVRRQTNLGVMYRKHDL